MPPRRRDPRDKSEVSLCIKYLLFSFNVFFWIVGLGVLAIGVFAWIEKQMFENIGELTDFFIDPGLAFMIVGAVIFIIGFTGCLGALRENTCLLMFFMLCLIMILLAQVTVAVLLFVYKDWVITKVTEGLQQFTERYRDDDDLQNIIDWVQDSWLYCCGVAEPDDWDRNQYFNCSSPSREACGVPFSCCKLEPDAIINLQCGYDVRLSDKKDKMGEVIYEQGCIPAAEAWIDTNIIPVAGTAVGIAVVEIAGIFLAYRLRSQIQVDDGRRRRYN